MKSSTIFLLLFTFTLYSCGGNTDTQTDPQVKIDSLQDKVDELEQKEREREQQKKDAEERKKAQELQDKKDLIISQIGAGIALKPQVYGFDPIGAGGINNAKLKIENDLVGIVFEVIKVRYTVYLDNGKMYNTEEFTFTNLKPGESRDKILFNTGNRGTKYEAVVTEIQSKWLTGGEAAIFN